MKATLLIIIQFFIWIGTTIWNNCQLWIYRHKANYLDRKHNEEHFVIPQGNYNLRIVNWSTFLKYNSTHHRKVNGKKIKKGNVNRLILYRTRKLK